MESHMWQHTGGMCDAEEFHAAVDDMASFYQAREGVLTLILAMIEPAGQA